VIPATFDYSRPRTVAEAVSMLASLGEEAKILTGGRSLLALMRLRFAAPAAPVDIQDLSELRFVARDGDRVRVGALTRHRDLEAHPVIRQSVPLLAVGRSHRNRRRADPQPQHDRGLSRPSRSGR